MSDTFRTHVPPHMRSIGEQTLDALLRIEELLTKLVALKEPVVLSQLPDFVEKADWPKDEPTKTEEKPARASRRRL